LAKRRRRERFDEASNRNRRVGCSGSCSEVLATHTHIALDIEIHDAYRVVPLNVIGFWFLMGIASVWFLIVVWESIRRHP